MVVDELLGLKCLTCCYDYQSTSDPCWCSSWGVQCGTISKGSETEIMYVKLQENPWTVRNHRHCIDDRWDVQHYSESFPFFLNPKGVLLHRVRHLYQIVKSPFEDDRRWMIDYWCENSGRSYGIQTDLLEVPPTERIVCARCEGVAIAAGELSSSKLCGRHVHIGGVRAVRYCCQPSN